MLVVALIVGGVGVQATGLLNTEDGGYLFCVNSKTKVVSHPGASKCPRGTLRLVLSAQGKAGKDGNTVWNGTTDPISTLGAPGDFFINTVTSTLFGPKNLDGEWPAGASMLGAKGDVGPIGLTGATGPRGGSGPIGPAGVAAPVATGGNCIGTKCTYKVGDTGPGGGLIFFVDYFDQYEGFNYLELAPLTCDRGPGKWVSDSMTSTSILGAAGWEARAVGRGSTNTDAMIAADPLGTLINNAAKFARSCTAGSKTDWFLPSLGELQLINENLQGLGGLVEDQYWSSSLGDDSGGGTAGNAKVLDFYKGTFWNFRWDLTGSQSRAIRAF